MGFAIQCCPALSFLFLLFDTLFVVVSLIGPLKLVQIG